MLCAVAAASTQATAPVRKPKLARRFMRNPYLTTQSMPKLGLTITRTLRPSKLQRARMADQDRARVRRLLCADLAECRAHLVDHDIEHMARALGPQRREPPQKRLAGKREIGAERHCAHDVKPRTNPGIQHHRRPRADRTLDRG